MNEVTLTWAEMFHGAQVGLMRRLKGLSRGDNRQGYGMEGLGWNQDIHGAIGELAFSKWLGVYWDNKAEGEPNKRPDVGGYEVKAISERNYRLIVRNTDKNPDQLFALVYGVGMEWQVIGWLRGGDAKRLGSVESHQGREPQYYVDQKHLHPFDEPDGGTAGGPA